MIIDTTYDFYARIFLLDQNDNVREQCIGKISAGSINGDGTSAVRRVCQLTLILDMTENIDIYNWGLQTRFKLETGIKTTSMEEIEWKLQGVYVITSFNAQKSNTHITINLNGKDKMCLLNGEIGGVLNAPVDFGTMEETTNNITTLISLPIPHIIREMVHTFGHEPYHNIILNDLDDSGLELLEYKNLKPMYLIREADKPMQYKWMTLDGDMSIFINGEALPLQNLSVYDDLSILQDGTSGGGTQFKLQQDGETPYCACKITYGMCAGYRETPLTYPGELIGNPGETITNILDKIKSALGSYEYFYDVYGRFIFQKVNQEKLVENISTTSTAELLADSFKFNDLSCFTNISIATNITNIKNDISIRGLKKTTNGSEIPILLRYAIDKKPLAYKTITVTDAELYPYNVKNSLFTVGQDSLQYISSETVPYAYYDGAQNKLIINANEWNYQQENRELFIDDVSVTELEDNTIVIGLENIDTLVKCDWRELIYQMALDHLKYGHLDNFEQKVAMANPNLFPTGKTGYEQYYTDILGFWRDIYNLTPTYVPTTDTTNLRYKKISTLQELTQAEMENFNQHKIRYDQYGNKSLTGEYIYIDEYTSVNATENDPDVTYYKQIAYTQGWNTDIIQNPSNLIFWLDFLDNTGELDQYSVKKIGVRPKVENNNNISTIYAQEIPNIIYYFDNSPEQQSGYTYLKLSENHSQAFEISTRGKSAYEAVNSLLYEYTSMANVITISSIPMSHLSLHDLITLDIDDSGLQGDYLITKITQPLSYNGTMTITASKILKQLL